MLSSNEGENDVFFDSLDCLSSEEPSLAEDELESSKLNCRIWMNEPASVKERKETFIQAMGLTEFLSKQCVSQEIEMDIGESCIGLDRLRECSEAVSSSCLSTSTSQVVENIGFCRREGNRANCMSDELQGTETDKLGEVCTKEAVKVSNSSKECPQQEARDLVERHHIFNDDKKKIRSWCKRFVSRITRDDNYLCKSSKEAKETSKKSRIRMQHNKKGCLEFTAPYIGQEISAHKGFIWTMKFSPDGQYLASGGEDGVVRVWHVLPSDISSDFLATGGNFCNKVNAGMLSFQQKRSVHPSVIFPEKVFRIEESPVHEFHGHSKDVLDLAWSNSNCLISSSMDETVRLWQVGCNQCLGIFQHSNYVTCVQFNPVNENYFISGSIDGKFRIWGLLDKRVVDWADVREVITAVCYQPDGEGFVVGSNTGSCSFYRTSGECLLPDAQIRITSRKKATGNKITGLKFSQGKRQRLMISSDDSKLRIFDGVDLVHKYKGLSKSRCQKSASFTSSGRHIISVGEDSRIYVWKYDGISDSSLKHKKSVRSCEHFFYEDVSVAIPWSVSETELARNNDALSQYSQQIHYHHDSNPLVRDSERFSLSNWFSIDGSCRRSATWPEEQLPSWDSFVPHEQNHLHVPNKYQHHCNSKVYGNSIQSETWGLVIVTAGWDGIIRTFHNYGLPMRL